MVNEHNNKYNYLLDQQHTYVCTYKRFIFKIFL